jgi:hypothetical protein
MEAPPSEKPTIPSNRMLCPGISTSYGYITLNELELCFTGLLPCNSLKVIFFVVLYTLCLRVCGGAALF